jgi:hypothetical protein
MPTFEPRSDEELNALIPDKTVCNFEVVSATEKKTNAGNPMLKLNLKLWTPDGKTKFVWDYLIFDMESAEWKIKNFCKAVGMDEQYKMGLLEAYHCEGKCGSLMVAIKRDKNGVYPDDNEVKQYLIEKDKPKATSEEIDDDIPF